MVFRQGSEGRKTELMLRQLLTIFEGRRTLAFMPAFIVSLALIFIANAKAQEPVAEIPYRYAYNGWITVPVTVNGQGPYDFIVDTGATLTVVFENLAEQQTFPFVDGEPRRILGLIEANDLPPRYIGRIETGGQAIDNVVSVVVNDWLEPRETPQGVLGLDFLERYAIDIDPTTRTIKLYEGGAPRIVDRRGWSDVRVEPKIFGDGTRPLYILRARIRGKSYPFILDLGASGTIINYPALRDMLSTRRVSVRSSATATRLPQVQDLFGNERETRLVRVKRIKLGNRSWRNVIVSVYNSEVFNELGLGDTPYGLLGADLFRNRRVVIDFPNNRLHVTREIKEAEQATN